MPEISLKTERSREWLRSNPEKTRLYNLRSRAHIRANPGLYADLLRRKREGAASRRATLHGALRGLLNQARYRASKRGLAFDISFEYLLSILPADGRCPYFKEKFVIGEGHSPWNISIDQIIPGLGYVRGNTQIISRSANTIKSDCADPAVFRRIADDLERNQIGRRLGCPLYR